MKRKQPNTEPVREDRQDWKPPEQAPTKYPGMAKEAGHIVQRVLANEMPLGELIEWCRKAELRWPLVGWIKSARDLEAFRNRPKKQPPEWAMSNAQRRRLQREVDVEPTTEVPF